MLSPSSSSVPGRLAQIVSQLPQHVQLVAVSKFHPAEAIREAYDAGQRVFGESRAQELTSKAAVLPPDIQWHFIGHLQTNKVRQVVAYCHTIQSVDSEHLFDAIVREATRAARHVEVLLQVHVAAEETKFGFSPDELIDAAPDLYHRALASGSVTIAGVMGMASNTDDPVRIESDFRAIRNVFDRLSHTVMSAEPSFRTVSMGMSHDISQAIECGSTMVRVGTAIFGDRT